MTNIYQTVYNAHQALSKALGDKLKPLGITGQQLTVMSAIMEYQIYNDAGPSQACLVITTGIDRSTMADIVRRLSIKGLIARKRQKDDARTYNVTLTEKGEDVAIRAGAVASSLETFIAQDRPSAFNGLEKKLQSVIEAARGTDGSVRSLMAAE